jgi:hypothetical protein
MRAVKWSLPLALVLLSGGAPPKADDGHHGLAFRPLSAAETDSEKRAVRASEHVRLGESASDIGYTTILRSGQSIGEKSEHVFGQHVFGQLVDDGGRPIVLEDGSKAIADSNDFSSFLEIGTKLFSVAQFESQPGAIYVTKLAQDAKSGALSAVETRPLDLAPIHGLWNPCAGVVTPWNTHLGSEEYEPDAKQGTELAATIAPFFGGGEVLGGDLSKVNPYHYGFPVEVTVKGEDGDAEVVKHYSMGRFAHELSYVLPDQKTVYQADDGTNVGLFLYVADQPGHLDSGALYALKWHQTSPGSESSLASADISFLELGHASDDEIEGLVADGVTFKDIFDSATPGSDGSCPEGFRAINANGVGLECLALQSGHERSAAFLETRRYSAYIGATTELRKEEGISFDPETHQLYVAYSELQYGMEDNAKNGKSDTTYDVGTSNDIRVLFNTCGAVYAYELCNDDEIGSQYVAKRVKGVLAGRMTTLIDPDKRNPTTVDAYPDDSPYAGSTCAIDGLANPDNIALVTGKGSLLIGEDSGDGHQNDAVWSYDLAREKLTRIETTPYGAESTSIYYYPNLGGFGYVASVVQHPYGETDEDKLGDPGDKHSYLGYLGPLPAQTKR